MGEARKVDFDKVKKNDLMAFIYYTKVDDVKRTFRGETLDVYDLDNRQPFQVHGRGLIENAMSADQYNEEKKVTKTEAAELLTTAYNRPFTVCFIKDDGSERVLRGRLLSTEPLLGRSYAEDLDVTEKNRTRLVDHRSIIFLIVDGVKYVVKSK